MAPLTGMHAAEAPCLLLMAACLVLTAKGATEPGVGASSGREVVCKPPPRADPTKHKAAGCQLHTFPTSTAGFLR